MGRRGQICRWRSFVPHAELVPRLDCHFSHHAFYDQRKDRRNFYELFEEVCLP